MKSICNLALILLLTLPLCPWARSQEDAFARLADKGRAEYIGSQKFIEGMIKLLEEHKKEVRKNIAFFEEEKKKYNSFKWSNPMSWTNPDEADYNRRSQKSRIKGNIFKQNANMELTQNRIEILKKMLANKDKMELFNVLYSANPNAANMDILSTVNTFNSPLNVQVTKLLMLPENRKLEFYLSHILKLDTPEAIEALKVVLARPDREKRLELAAVAKINDKNKLEILNLYKAETPLELGIMGEIDSDVPLKAYHLLAKGGGHPPLELIASISTELNLEVLSFFEKNGFPINARQVKSIKNPQQLKVLEYLVQNRIFSGDLDILAPVTNEIPLAALEKARSIFSNDPHKREANEANVKILLGLDNPFQLELLEMLVNKKVEKLDLGQLPKVKRLRQLEAFKVGLAHNQVLPLKFIAKLDNDHQLDFIKFIMGEKIPTFVTKDVFKVENPHQVEAARLLHAESKGHSFPLEMAFKFDNYFQVETLRFLLKELPSLKAKTNTMNLMDLDMDLNVKVPSPLSLAQILNVGKASQLDAIKLLAGKNLELNGELLAAIKEPHQLKALEELLKLLPIGQINPKLFSKLSLLNLDNQLEFLKKVIERKMPLTEDIIDLMAIVRNIHQSDTFDIILGEGRENITMSELDQIEHINNPHQVKFLKTLIAKTGKAGYPVKDLVTEFFFRMKRINNPFQVETLEKAIGTGKEIDLVRIANISSAKMRDNYLANRYFFLKKLKYGPETPWGEEEAPSLSSSSDLVEACSPGDQPVSGLPMVEKKNGGLLSLFTGKKRKKTKVIPVTAQRTPAISSDGISTADIPGIANLGNTCFANSTFKLLSQFFNLHPERMDLFNPHKHKLIREAKETDAAYKSRQDFQVLLGQLMEAFLNSDEEHVVPIAGELFSQFEMVLKSRGERIGGPQDQIRRHQFDAGEFMNKVLDLIDFGSSPYLPETADILKKGNRNGSVTRTKNPIIQIEVQDFNNKKLKSLQSGFDQSYTQVEKIDGVLDEETGQKGTAKKGSVFLTPPQTLLVQEKRSVYGRDDGAQKLGHEVVINDQLELKIFDEGLKIKGIAVMEPRAIVVHDGKSPKSGHYYAYLKDKDKWTIHNDSTVKTVSASTVKDDALKDGYIVLYELKEYKKFSDKEIVAHEEAREKKEKEEEESLQKRQKKELEENLQAIKRAEDEQKLKLEMAARREKERERFMGRPSVIVDEMGPTLMDFKKKKDEVHHRSNGSSSPRVYPGGRSPRVIKTFGASFHFPDYTGGQWDDVNYFNPTNKH